MNHFRNFTNKPENHYFYNTLKNELKSEKLFLYEID